MAAATPHEFVPLCTCADGAERELRLRGAGIDVLESEHLATRKIVLIGVLHIETADDHAAGESASSSTTFTGERGIYISTLAEDVPAHDASALTLILRNVDLHREPYWGSLLVLFTSHLFLARTGPITPASFDAMAFLTNYWQIQVLDRGHTGKPEDNARLLAALAPRFTWAAIDLKQKDLDGCEGASKYLEQQLAKPTTHGVGADAQVLLNSLLPTRDCVIVKSTALTTPPGFATPQAVTSAKLLAHALDSAEPKAFFGRFVTGSLLLHLVRSVAAGIVVSTPFVLQRVVTNVMSHYWQTLVTAALTKYTDLLHARIGVYEPVAFSASYVLDITARKLETQQIAVVNAGQGKFSAFDEFGNLKRQVSTDSDTVSSPHGGHATLNTGIFTFLKDRAERAFTKQFSLFEPSTTATAKSLTAASSSSGLADVPESDSDDDDDEGGSVRRTTTGHPATEVRETPLDVLQRCNVPIQAYAVPMTYLHTASESMPMDTAALDAIHNEALTEAKAVIEPFLFDLRCSTVAHAELATTLSLSVGKRNLLKRIARVKQRFEAANRAASTLFCAELVRYLHAIVLSKSASDAETQKKRAPPMRRNTMSVLHVGSGADDKDAGPPLTKLPMELLTYKTNLEALVSQYNFVARGPLATRVLLAFFQTAVRSRLAQLAAKEFDRFDAVGDARRAKLDELDDALVAKQRSVAQAHSVNAELALQESQLLDDVARTHAARVAELEQSIRDAEARVAAALSDQQALYQSTMLATRKTLNTMDRVAVKNRLFLGYLKRFEKGHLFSKSWRQYYYVLDNATLRCYASKSAYEERKAPIEPPVVLTGYNVVKSRTDEMKIKLIPPEAGTMLRFRAPVSVGRETWMKRFLDAAQLTESDR